MATKILAQNIGNSLYHGYKIHLKNYPHTYIIHIATGSQTEQLLLIKIEFFKFIFPTEKESMSLWLHPIINGIRYLNNEIDNEMGYYYVLHSIFYYLF